MSVKSCENLEKSQVKLTIEVGAEEFEKAVNKAYLQMRGKMNVPGFRPGKAPRKIIEGMYGAEVFYEEAVNIVLPDAYEAAVQEQKLEVVGYPQVELESCGKDGVVFQCTVAVYPEVTLGQYKGLEAPRAEVKVMAADVNARLKEMAERNSRLVSVERAVKKGDTATIDFEGFDNGVAFDGGKGENFDLEIGSGSFVPGFEDQLVGMKAGEEKDIDITFPENYTPCEGQRGEGQGDPRHGRRVCQGRLRVRHPEGAEGRSEEEDHRGAQGVRSAGLRGRADAEGGRGHHLRYPRCHGESAG